MTNSRHIIFDGHWACTSLLQPMEGLHAEAIET